MSEAIGIRVVVLDTRFARDVKLAFKTDLKRLGAPSVCPPSGYRPLVGCKDPHFLRAQGGEDEALLRSQPSLAGVRRACRGLSFGSPSLARDGRPRMERRLMVAQAPSHGV